MCVPQKWTLVLSHCSFSCFGDYWKKTELGNVRDGAECSERVILGKAETCVSDRSRDDQKTTDSLVHKERIRAVQQSPR